jgi:MFS family permease
VSSGLLRSNGPFGALWAARVVSFGGDQLTIVALTLLVHARYGTGPSVAGLLLAVGVPRLLGPVAGAVVDRVDQRWLMRTCELGRAGVVTLIALTLPPLPVLLALVAVVAVLATLFMPAGRGAVPVLVGHHDLQQANALIATGTNLGLAIGPAVGGGLVALVGTSGTLLVDAATSLVAAALLGRLPELRPGTEPDRGAAGFGSDVSEGLRYVAGERTLRTVFLALFAGVALAAMANVAAVFLIRDTLGAGPTAFGLFASAWGIGMIGGSLAIARWGRRLDPARLFAGGWVLTGGGIVGAGLSPSIPSAVGAFTLGGVGNGLENVAVDTLVQQVAPRRFLGRAFGAVYAGAFVGELVAYAVGGQFLELTDPRTVFVVAGAATLAIAVWITLRMSRTGEAPGTEGDTASADDRG